MDTRLRYGLGVLMLGLGNLTVGITQFVVGDQSTLIVVLELVVGVLLIGFGAAVVNNPDRLDADQISTRLFQAIGWIGIVLGGLMLVWSAIVVVGAL
ncbi:hypothetical protein [Halorhabdus amylolytica]|uniref:hypothetical protein n=1 Tax=Halorhabdus amylolytica TaxID=2559573 RepID=UPI0010A9B432|nr:hypothetical protein [Halorhabdus amylolytica]